jgi:hypothetical protein
VRAADSRVGCCAELTSFMHRDLPGPRKRLIIIVLVVVWRWRGAVVWSWRRAGARGIWRSIRPRPRDPIIWTASFECGSTARREPGCILLQAGDNSAHIRNLVTAESPDVRRTGHLLLGGAAIFLSGCRAGKSPAADQEREPQRSSLVSHVGASQDETGRCCMRLLDSAINGAAERFSPTTKREAHMTRAVFDAEPYPPRDEQRC